jgi:hypothetical protein
MICANSKNKVILTYLLDDTGIKFLEKSGVTVEQHN